MFRGQIKVTGVFRGQTLSKVTGVFRGQTLSKVAGVFRGQISYFYCT